MGSTFRRVATVFAVAALATIGATAGVAATPQTYTCTKSKKHGQTEVRTSVLESAVSGLTTAGFVCVADTPTDEDEGEGTGEGTTDDGPADEGPTNDESADDSTAEDHPSTPTAPQPASVPEESRSLYCSTRGAVDRSGDADGPGVTLDLPDSQGALLVERGLATPAMFYAGVGVSCDVLPGYTYAGFWVDHVGDVVPGVAVYPYYVPTA
jgi:hypothetical protein